MGQSGICLFGIAVAVSESESVDDDRDIVSMLRGAEMDGAAVEEDR